MERYFDLVEAEHYAYARQHAYSDRVSAVVTHRGVFTRADDGELVLTRLLLAPGEDETAAVELIRSRVGWPLRLAPTLEREPPPDPAALAELRRFDPRRSFIGKPGSLAE